jgi:hypothetical protein
LNVHDLLAPKARQHVARGVSPEGVYQKTDVSPDGAVLYLWDEVYLIKLPIGRDANVRAGIHGFIHCHWGERYCPVSDGSSRSALLIKEVPFT